MTVRVVLADDQELIRSGLRMMLDAHPEITVVAEAGNGVEAVAAVDQHRVDVVLMDVQMPVLDGLAATRRLLAAPREPPTKVVMLTTFEYDEYVYEALRAGASGYLLKSVRPEELAPAITTVHRGGALIDPTVTRRLVERFALQARLDQPDPRLSDLTPRERDVLISLAAGRSNEEIAADLYLSTATVKTHVRHLLAKLGLRDRTQAVVLAYESGLIRPGN